MTNWFVQNRDKKEEDVGPLRPSELLERVRKGEVTQETMVRKDDSPWFQASQVGGLFEAARRPTIEYFCPQCETEVSEPPVLCSNCGLDVHQAITRITENSIGNQADRSFSSQAGKSVKNWLLKKRIRKDNKKTDES
ncbi:hypothetical protein Poly51_42180 [Rubripirellula tenax]|uniref:GYF domain-containing protein n=1 Tax=Rubripirellula tenax TaxID=2528015 RepID=A0A5C6EQK8_9BACT|nr:DUF4339 domain-containing protein [Rubripirellula tenax]TWU50925.1 hypothetical protein Poly51_42180 [Rubripirellula tenax]